MKRAVCVALCVFLWAPFAYAQSASDLQKQIDDRSSQIIALKAEIAGYQTQLVEIGKQKNTLQNTISSYTISQKQLAAQIALTKKNIEAAGAQITQLTGQIGDKESTIAENKMAIGRALQEIALDEGAPLFSQVLSAHSLTEAWQVAEENAQFNRALAGDIALLKSAREALADNRDAVAAEQKKLQSLQSDLTIQKRSVDASKAAEQKLLADTNNKESNYQKLIAQKKAEEAAFESLLFELQSRLQYVLDPSKIPPAGKGVLHWPLDNVYITQLFGQTSSSGRLYASGTHNGIDFRASIGTPVRAAQSGMVLEVNYGSAANCQYGKWVLIRHPDGLATLYAHLSDISVAKNTEVTSGQVIGFSGSTGYATGPHLHLTVFYADAISFRQYQCKSGAYVMIPIAPIQAYLDPLAYL